MYYVLPGCQSSVFGKNCAYYIRIFTVVCCEESLSAPLWQTTQETRRKFIMHNNASPAAVQTWQERSAYLFPKAEWTCLHYYLCGKKSRNMFRKFLKNRTLKFVTLIWPIVFALGAQTFWWKLFYCSFLLITPSLMHQMTSDLKCFRKTF